jgi:hypothetical protein
MADMIFWSKDPFEESDERSIEEEIIMPRKDDPKNFILNTKTKGIVDWLLTEIKRPNKNSVKKVFKSAKSSLLSEKTKPKTENVPLVPNTSPVVQSAILDFITTNTNLIKNSNNYTNTAFNCGDLQQVLNKLFDYYSTSHRIEKLIETQIDISVIGPEWNHETPRKLKLLEKMKRLVLFYYNII